MVLKLTDEEVERRDGKWIGLEPYRASKRKRMYECPKCGGVVYKKPVLVWLYNYQGCAHCRGIIVKRSRERNEKNKELQI